LQNNSITGTIPTELGLLSGLNSDVGLRLGSNRLTGSVPSEVCQLSLSLLVRVAVDCLELECDCNCMCAEDFAGDFNYYDDDDDTIRSAG
jgi:hypothetical protein